MILNQTFEQLRELDLYSNKLVNINFKSDLNKKLPSLKKITLSKNDLSVLDVFKTVFMFNFVDELNVDNNLLALPEESQEKVPAFIEQNKDIQISIAHFSYKNSLVDSSITDLLLPLLN